MTRKIARNLASSALVTAVSAAAVIAIQVLVSRAYGSTVFGVYTLVLGIGRITLAASDLGIDMFVYREVSRSTDRASEWVDTGLYLRLRLALVCTVVSIVLFWILGPQSSTVAALILFLDLIVGDLAVFLSHVFIARRETHLQALVAVPILLLRIVVCALALLGGGELWQLGLGLLACHAAQLGWSLRVAGRRGWSTAPRPIHVRPLLEGALPMGISNVVRALYFKLDSLLLAAMLTTRDVGLYNAAYLLATGTSLASVVVRSIAFPEMSSAFDAGRAFVRVLGRFAVAVVVMGALSFVLVWVLGPWLIDRVFGVEFAAAKELIPVFAGVAAVVFINEAAQATLLATHQQTLDLRCGVFALVLNVGLNLVLIPRIGIAGAAWATLGAETAGAVTRVWFGRAHIRTRLQAV